MKLEKSEKECVYVVDAEGTDDYSADALDENLRHRFVTQLVKF